MTSVDEFVNSSAWLVKVSGAQRGRERYAAPAADAHGGRIAARALPPRPLTPPRPDDNMELATVPRYRPLAFDKMEALIKEMQDPEVGVPVRSQKLFLAIIPSAFMGSDLVEWLMAWFNSIDSTIADAIALANQLCQHGYFFPVNDSKNLVVKDDSSLYRFQTPYYWPWQGPRVAGTGSSGPTIGPDNVEYAIYLVKRTLRNKQRHGLDEYEQEALANLKKNLSAKWDFITMQAEEQVRLAKERKKGDKVVSDSQERAFWRVARPPPGVSSVLDHCPVPVRSRQPKPKKRTIQQVTREIEHLKASLDRTRVKTSIALEALMAYSETFTPYDPMLTPPQPSNPWISEDPILWQINSPIVLNVQYNNVLRAVLKKPRHCSASAMFADARVEDFYVIIRKRAASMMSRLVRSTNNLLSTFAYSVEVPSEKRVQRWALSIEELLSDPTGLQEFTSFLRKEYSHENIRFWLAVMDLRRSSNKQIPKKLGDIYEEFLKPGAPCEINIDGATAERVTEGIKSGSRYALDHAADHVYGLLLKKDCYPRFIRSDHFQRLLAEGRNVYQKKAKFFNFGGQVKKKPGTSSGSGGGGVALSRRRGSDRSLSGSAHELAVCAAQPPRAPDPPPHSHSQSNLSEIPFRDPLDNDTADIHPWENSSRECPYGATRRRQDSTADSGSSSSDVSAAVVTSERIKRLPQQSTLDGGLRGAPPPLRRLSAVEPRHLAPLGSPPHSPRHVRVMPAPQPPPLPAPIPSYHPTPTISVSSAPDDESTNSPTRTASPEDRRSLAHSEEPSSVFASADVTPTEPALVFADRCLTVIDADAATDPGDPKTDVLDVNLKATSDDTATITASISSCDDSRTETKEDSQVDSRGESRVNSREDWARSSEDEPSSVRLPPSREASVSIEDAWISSRQVGHEKIKDGLACRLGSEPTGDVNSVVSVPEPNTTNDPEASTSGSQETANAQLPGASAPSSGRMLSGSPAVPVAPLAVCEDIGVDDENVDKVPSVPTQRVSEDSTAASESNKLEKIAHRDELSSVSVSDIVRRASKSGVNDRKQRNDICPWEDENSCDSDAPFVKTYATLGYL